MENARKYETSATTIDWKMVEAMVHGQNMQLASFATNERIADMKAAMGSNTHATAKEALRQIVEWYEKPLI